MSRRPDPARIRQAREDALRQRLAGDGMLPELVDGWMARIQRHPADRESATYWDAMYTWITAQHHGGRKPDDGKNPIES